MAITTNYPSGMSGNIRCTVSAGIAVVEFDGFKCSSTGWRYSVASGFPKPSASRWFTLNSDVAGPVKMNVDSNGVLSVRCTQNDGAEHLVDSTAVYPVV